MMPACRLPPAVAPRAPVVIALLMACLLLAAAPASASRMTRKAARLSDEAGRLFKAEQYREAAERFEQSYALDPRKLIRLRNAGRAYEEAGLDARALHVFERYVTLVEDAKLKADAEARIARIRAALAPPAVAPVDEKPAPPAPTEPGTTPATVAPTIAAQKPVSRLPAWITAGTGALIAGTGAVWVAAAGRAADAIDSDDGAGRYGYDGGAGKLRDDRATVRRHRIAAWTAVGVGAAALAGGVVWALLPPAAPTGDATAWTLTPTRGGLQALGRFRF